MQAIACLYVVGMLCLASNARAQVADTTQAAPPDTSQIAMPDSLAPGVPSDTLAEQIQVPAGPPIPFLHSDPSWAIGDTLPTRLPALGAVDLLGDLPGSFVYDFGTHGWPDGWSPYGLPPHQMGLMLNGVPLDDPVTGRPFYEMLPLALLEPLRAQGGRQGRPLATYGWLRSFDGPRPVTEIRFRSGGSGLQRVLVVHSQQRRARLFGRPGSIGLALAYGGHGANGEYPGSKLTRTRQLVARLRYQQSRFSLEIVNMQNRRRVGAHAGVQQTGSTYESIYNRLSAGVRNSNAKRAHIRNDLNVTLRTRLFGRASEPLSVQGYWTAQTSRYFDSTVQLRARTDRLGYRVEQGASVGRHRLAARFEGWSERITSGNALPDSLGLKRTPWHLTLSEAFNASGIDVNLEGGWHNLASGGFLGGGGRVSIDRGRFALRLEGAYSGRAPAWVEQYGWGGTVLSEPSLADTRIAWGRVGASVQFGPIDLAVHGFAHSTKQATDFVTTAQQDTIEVLRYDGNVTWIGVAGELGFRRNAERGIYAVAMPTLYQMQDRPESEPHRTARIGMPEVSFVGRAGLRYLLFRGDLDVDLYARGRFWPAFTGRTLHPQTGLLVLRREGSRPIDPSIALDVVLEAGIRTAKVFVAMDNVLSGNAFLGNLIIPDYPLPAQRFRFGVFWPIFD